MFKKRYLFISSFAPSYSPHWNWIKLKLWGFSWRPQKNYAPQLFISVSTVSANSEGLSGRNMSSKIASSQSHLLMKKEKKFLLPTPPHPTPASALTGNSLNKTNKLYTSPGSLLTLSRLFFPQQPGGLGKTSCRFPCYTSRDCGVWWLQGMSQRDLHFSLAEQLNSLTLQMSHLDTIDWKGELGANIGISEIQMLFVSYVFPDQINKLKKQSPWPPWKNIMCPRYFCGWWVAKLGSCFV